MRLNDLAVIRSGLVLARKQARETSQFRYSLLNLRSIEANGTININLVEMFYAAEPLSRDYLTHIGDVVIRLSAPYSAVLIDDSTAGMVISSNFAVIRVDNEILLPAYLHWLMNTAKVRKQIYENATSNMLGAINTKFLAGFEISVLPVAQQEKIAAINQLAKRETQLLSKLAIEKEKYYSAVIDKAQKEMRRGKKHDDEK